MSFSGGVFSINSTGQPVVAGTTISASVFNALTADLATGLSTCMLKDGTQTATAGIGFYAGTVSLPGIYFGTDTATGFYRIGLNNNGYTVNGTKLLDLSSASLAITGAVSATGKISGTAGLLVSGTIASGAASAAEGFEVQGATDSLMGLYRTGTANTTDECAYIMWAKDAGGTVRKTMSISNIWRSTSATNGYTVTRYNADYLVAGVGTDDLSIRQFGGVGITLFGTGDSDEPDDVADGVTKLLSRGPVSVYGNTDAVWRGLGVRNTSTGTSAYSRVRIGNNVSENAATLDMYGGNHSTKPSYFEVMNQIDAPLVFGVNGTEAGRVVSAAGGQSMLLGTTDTTSLGAYDFKMSGALWIGDGVTAPSQRAGFAVIYVDAADGDLKVKFGDGVTKTLATDT